MVDQQADFLQHAPPPLNVEKGIQMMKKPIPAPFHLPLTPHNFSKGATFFSHN